MKDRSFCYATALLFSTCLLGSFHACQLVERNRASVTELPPVTDTTQVGEIVQTADNAREQGLTTVDSLEYHTLIRNLAVGDTSGRWPVIDQPVPLAGAILPYKRIIAFYGNLYSARMGILGALPPDELLAKLDEEVAAWNAADTVIEAIPALHYIAVTAQSSAGRDGKYRSRMPFSQIDSVLSIAKKRNALVFLDIQVGFSDLQAELPRLDTFLCMPNVHLGIDPEFSMKDDLPPGKRIGHFTAKDINFAMEHLATLVRTKGLAPKVLVVHRFTQGMIKDYQQIRLDPAVQVVIDMDGWGAPALKRNTYQSYVFREPVQFTGFKFFYKNDLIPSPHRMMTATEVNALIPKPIYIQYQ
ncbi:hypothetical protein ACFQRK_15655 [Parapedobacter sp. GCM10030251]|uniref:hypothetical protein n=1 Tax=Parapedobacter sp. GCM10030251 TaxID=3273419 RepID=UPI003616F598